MSPYDKVNVTKWGATKTIFRRDVNFYTERGWKLEAIKPPVETLPEIETPTNQPTEIRRGRPAKNIE